MESSKVQFRLRLPSLDYQRSSFDVRRRWVCFVNKQIKLETQIPQDIDCTFKLGTELEIRKMFGKKVDSTFTYIIGDDFATLVTAEETIKLIAFHIPGILKAVANNKTIDKNRLYKKKRNETRKINP